MRVFLRIGLVSGVILFPGAAHTVGAADAASFDLSWDVGIPMRDGVRLSANIYKPHAQHAPLPCVFTLTPYVAQTFHDQAISFAEHGYDFVAVDARGRGNSAGSFEPYVHEARDGPDVVEWLARQPFCNGKVAMWGAGYAGNDQWATAAARPPHLVTIIPVASNRAGVDIPWQNTIFWSYDIEWLLLMAGHTSQSDLFGDNRLMNSGLDAMFREHRPFDELDRLLGYPSPVFQGWLKHPFLDAFWDARDPGRALVAGIDIPVLTITGQYDDDQAGALSFYADGVANASPGERGQHYLVIGPWDHAGTSTPETRALGLTFGDASRIDIARLERDWYDWTMKGSRRPAFLKAPVSFYVLGEGAEQWHYARSLTAVTSGMQAAFLRSGDAGAGDVFHSGVLAASPAAGGQSADRYVYDPRDTSFDVLGNDADDMTDQVGLGGVAGKFLIYHTPVLTSALEIAGFFKLSLWLAIDQSDTDIIAMVFQVSPDGSSIKLAQQVLRARFRHSLWRAEPIGLNQPERYDFHDFNFVARRLPKGSRLRLIVAPLNTDQMEKNYNASTDIAGATAADARTVTVTLFHDAARPSALYIPREAGPNARSRTGAVLAGSGAAPQPSP